jgi:hypothetical protein
MNEPEISDKPLIIYVIADKRSGSTLLDYLLSSHPDSISLGELRLLSGHYHRIRAGERWGWNCSCGQPIASCNFWTAIFNRLNVTEAPDTFLDNSITSINLYKPVKKTLKKAFQVADEKAKIIAGNCWKIYNAVFQETGKKIITDSSKNAVQAWYLWKYRQGNIKFIFLERDIRAIAFSKMKRTTNNPKQENYSVFKNLIGAFKVARQNKLISEMLTNNGGKVITINYNDLVTQKDETILAICNFMNIRVFIPPDEFEAHVQHTIAGSPHRFSKNKIIKDERWLDFYKNKTFISLVGKYLANKA